MAGCSSSTAPTATASAHPTATGDRAAGVRTPAPTGPATGGLQRFYGQHLDWHGCGQGFQCADLTVPLDYHHPEGRTITVAVDRLPASDPGKRIGSLVVNPGGPGASGLQFARYADQLLPADVRARFDVVGFDPRGVGQSTPVKCVSDQALDRYIATDPVPDNPQEMAATIASAKSFAQACAKRSGDLLAHVGTLDVARDMDVLRAVLGDDRLTYLGESYGTFLGAKYAHLFPTHIRAMVLDGALDPTQDTTDLNRVQAAGFDTELGRFLAWCAQRSCPLGGTAAAARAGLQRLEQRVDAHPEATLNGRSLGPGEFFEGLAAGLYSTSYWPQLETALQQTQDGRGGLLLAFSDSLVGRGPDGSYDNEIEANNAVNCIDRPSPRDVAAYQQQAKALAATAPVFGPAIVYGSLTCAFWPVPPVEGTEPVHAKGAPPIVVVGTTRDPATPYVWAQSLARQLDSGVLVTHVGDGHTAYGHDDCVDAAVNRYLLTTRPPKDGLTCA